MAKFTPITTTEVANKMSSEADLAAEVDPLWYITEKTGVPNSITLAKTTAKGPTRDQNLLKTDLLNIITIRNRILNLME